MDIIGTLNFIKPPIFASQQLRVGVYGEAGLWIAGAPRGVYISGWKSPRESGGSTASRSEFWAEGGVHMNIMA